MSVIIEAYWSVELFIETHLNIIIAITCLWLVRCPSHAYSHRLNHVLLCEIVDAFCFHSCVFVLLYILFFFQACFRFWVSIWTTWVRRWKCSICQSIINTGYEASRESIRLANICVEFFFFSERTFRVWQQVFWDRGRLARLMVPFPLNQWNA